MAHGPLEPLPARRAVLEAGALAVPQHADGLVEGLLVGGDVGGDAGDGAAHGMLLAWGLRKKTYWFLGQFSFRHVWMCIWGGTSFFFSPWAFDRRGAVADGLDVQRRFGRRVFPDRRRISSGEKKKSVGKTILHIDSRLLSGYSE